MWSYDHKRLRWEEREVVESYQLAHRGTMATPRAGGEIIRATGGHPVWVVQGEGLANRPHPVRILAHEVGSLLPGRWVLARDLRAGDEVLLRSSKIVPLETVELAYVGETVYNFHVAELQNYAVGECGLLVHNTNTHLGSINSTINQGKQARHILGDQKWIDEGQKSYLTSAADAQAVLDAVHSGQARILGTTSQGHLVVRYNGVTGYNNNPGAGFIHQGTSVFMIKGTTNPSVVPTNPLWKP